MSQWIIWNRRSGKDRRATDLESNPQPPTDDRRTYDRRLYGNNDYLLIVGQLGIDRFTLLFAFPVLLITLGVLAYGARTIA